MNKLNTLLNIAVPFLLILTSCTDAEFAQDPRSLASEQEYRPEDLLPGILNPGVLIASIAQLPTPLNGEGCAQNQIIQWNGVDAWSCVDTPSSAPSSMTASNISPGIFQSGVLLPTGQLSGLINPTTQLDGSSCLAGQILESDGTSFTCTALSTTASSVPASGITSGTVGTGVILPPSQVGDGALNPNTSIFTNQLTGGIDPATQIANGSLPIGVTLSGLSQLPSPLDGSACLVNEVLQWKGGTWDCVSLPGGSDNLGNHTAAQNIDLFTFQLVGNGGTSGISVANNGEVQINNSWGLKARRLYMDGGITNLRSDTLVRWHNPSGSQASKLISKKNATSTNIGDEVELWTAGGGLEVKNPWGLVNTYFQMGSSTNSGNVGVGTATPNYKLHLHQNHNLNNIIQFTNADTGSSNADGMIIGINSSQQGLVAVREAQPLIFRTSDQEQVRITAEGKVGIGTDTPISKFQIGDTPLATSFYAADSHAYNSPFIAINNTEATVNSETQPSLILARTKHRSWPLKAHMELGTTNMNDGYARTMLNFRLSATSRLVEGDDLPIIMTMLSNGNVGIGTDNPSELLTVNNGSTVGTYETSGWMHSSDETLKKDIVSLDRAESLEKILELRPVHYIFKKDTKAKQQLGFIAQEVKPLFKEVVSKDKNTGLLRMAYGNLIAPLVSALQELYSIVFQNSEKIEQLEKQNKELIERIKDLETQIK